jgi:hypothetical protein
MIYRRVKGEFMDFKRVLMWFIVLVFVAGFAAVGFAEEAKKYPPYPDVWGYGSPWPTQSHVNLYKMPNGDYAITYKQEKQAGNEYVVKFFFSGKEIYLTKEEYKK